jgi:FlaG/FlaF family flagellin (archaellin)
MSPRKPLGRRRKGTSPILAELLLMAATLVAGLQVGSFGFQLVGVASHSAMVQASGAVCGVSGRNITCSVSLHNSGSVGVYTLSACSINGYSGALAHGGYVPAGGQAEDISCTVITPAVQSDGTATGWVMLANGADIYFAASD